MILNFFDCARSSSQSNVFKSICIDKFNEIAFYWCTITRCTYGESVFMFELISVFFLVHSHEWNHMKKKMLESITFYCHDAFHCNCDFSSVALFTDTVKWNENNLLFERKHAPLSIAFGASHFPFLFHFFFVYSDVSVRSLCQIGELVEAWQKRRKRFGRTTPSLQHSRRIYASRRSVNEGLNETFDYWNELHRDKARHFFSTSNTAAGNSK